MNLNKIEFKDLPSEETPLDAATLNTMQDNIEDCILANKGVIEFEGTIESPIDANKIVNVGVYKISGNKINFYNNETETLILEVTLNNTALVQSITTSEGIALRVGQYADAIWSFGEWNVLTGEKQVGYENEELEGTEKIIIEASDFDGVVADEENIYSTNEVRICTWKDGKPLYRKVLETTAPSTTADGTYVSEYIDIADNIDNAILEFAYLTDSFETNIPIPYITNAGYQIKVNMPYYNNKKTLCVYNGVKTYNGCTLIASILYTKTTD